MPALVKVEGIDGPVLFEGQLSDAALHEIAIQDKIEDVINTADTSLSTVAATVRRCATGLLDAFDDLTSGQRSGGSFSEAVIELGVTVTGEGNVIVARGSAEANLKVTLTWTFA
jgi:hypothetical protein